MAIMGRRRAGIVGRCEDCRQPIWERGERYTIHRPDGSVFRLCVPCWDNLVGSAFMAAVR